MGQRSMSSDKSDNILPHPESCSPEPQKTHLTDDQLMDISVKELNNMMKTTGLEKGIIEGIKKKRRTLKNRKYAANSRNLKEDEEEDLRMELEKLKKENEVILKRNTEKKRALDVLKESYRFRQEWAERLKIPLPDHLIRTLKTEHKAS